MLNIWEELSVYESVDMIHRIYRKRHDLEPSSTKVRQIVFNITHAREYFRSASDAQIYVKPLILYYGILSLSRALILFHNHSALETNLTEGHGVNTTQWKERLSADGIRSVPTLKVDVSSGTFSDFCNATKNTEIVRTHDMDDPISTTQWKKTGTSDIGGLSVTIKEILAHIPELSGQFERTFEESSHCFRAISYLRSNIEYSNIKFLTDKCASFTDDQIRTMFNLSKDFNIARYGESNNVPYRLAFVIRNPSEQERIGQLPPLRNDAEGNLFVVAPLKGTINLSSMSWLYLISFAMGMLVRYYPTSWTQLINKEKGDFIMPLLQSATGLLETRFPALVSREMENSV